MSDLFQRPAAEVRPCIPYVGQDDLFVRLEGILNAPSAWCYRDVGCAGRAEVLAHHTYAHRAAQMLAAL